MAAEVNELAARKRQLLAESELCRQSLEMEFQTLKTATAWVPRTVKIARSVYPILFLAAPLLGYAFTRKRPRPTAEDGQPARRGLLAKALAGYRLFRKVKPVWEGVRSWRG